MDMTPSGADSTCRKPILNAICLACVVVVAVIMLHAVPYQAANLDVVPDSVEYAVGSAHLIRDGSYSITIDGVRFPPRYSPAFSLILAPAYLIAGTDELGNGIYVVTILAVLGVVAAYAIGHMVSGCPGGLMAAGGVLLLTGYLDLGRKIMADVPGAALSLLACRLYLLLHKRQQPGMFPMFAAGCTVALAAGLRPALLALALPFMPLVYRRLRSGAWILLLPVAVVVGLTCLYDFRTFGSIFRSGYNFWCPVPYDFFGLTLSPSYLKENLQTLLATPFLPLAGVTLASLAVMGKLNPYDRDTGFMLKGLAAFIAPALLPYLLFHLLYFYSVPRFFLPITCLMVAVAGGVAGCFFRNKPYVYGSAFLCLALLISAVGWRMTVPADRPERRELADAVNSLTPDNAVIIAATDPVYLGYLTAEQTRRTIVPLSRNVEYASKLIAPVKLLKVSKVPEVWWDHRAPGLLSAGAKEAVGTVALEDPGMIDRYLASGRRVFLLKDMTFDEDVRAAEDLLSPYLVMDIPPGILELLPRNQGGKR